MPSLMEIMRHKGKTVFVATITIVKLGYSLTFWVNLSLPIMREKTGSAELRMSSDMQFAMI